MTACFLQLLHKASAPEGISFVVSLTRRGVGFDCRNTVERRERFVGISIYTCADTSTTSCAECSVGVVEADDSSGDCGQCRTEKRTEKHVGMTGMDIVYMQAHSFHDFDAIAEGIDNAFLRGTKKVGTGVEIEVESLGRTPYGTSAGYTLCTVAERNDAESSTTDWC